MHAVRVSDPWFGGWIRCGFGGGWPIFYVGPLFDREVRLETIWTGPTVAKNGATNEKPCHHTYVEGSVTGYTDGSTSAIVFGPEGGSRTAETVLYGGKVVYRYEITVRGSSTRSSGSAYFEATCVQSYYYKGVLQPGYPKTGGFSWRLRRVRDEYTKSVAYDSPVLVSRWGYCSSSAYVLASSSPYGSGAGDTFIGGTSHIQYWIEKTLQTLGDPGEYRSARDEAILSAVDNLELGQINPLNDFTDMLSPLAGIRRLADTIRSMSNWKSVVKGIASLHLFWDYVVKTNLMTAREVDGIRKSLAAPGGGLRSLLCPETLEGRGQATIAVKGGSITYHAKAVYGSGWGPVSVLSQLMLQGLIPTVEDLWDLVPYSFVVDWVLPIGEAVGRMEKLGASLSLPLYYIVLSKKTVRHVAHSWQQGGHTFNVNLTAVDYYRSVTRRLPKDLGLGADRKSVV